MVLMHFEGVLDPNTRDWTDGLLSNIFRDINKPQAADKKDLKYILFDGDVDPVWYYIVFTYC